MASDYEFELLPAWLIFNVSDCMEVFLSIIYLSLSEIMILSFSIYEA